MKAIATILVLICFPVIAVLSYLKGQGDTRAATRVELFSSLGSFGPYQGECKIISEAVVACATDHEITGMIGVISRTQKRTTTNTTTKPLSPLFLVLGFIVFAYGYWNLK